MNRIHEKGERMDTVIHALFAALLAAPGILLLSIFAMGAFMDRRITGVLKQVGIVELEGRVIEIKSEGAQKIVQVGRVSRGLLASVTSCGDLVKEEDMNLRLATRMILVLTFVSIGVVAADPLDKLPRDVRLRFLESLKIGNNGRPASAFVGDVRKHLSKAEWLHFKAMFAPAAVSSFFGAVSSRCAKG
jgi:hypothetical protein